MFRPQLTHDQGPGVERTLVSGSAATIDRCRADRPVPHCEVSGHARRKGRSSDCTTIRLTKSLSPVGHNKSSNYFAPRPKTPHLAQRVHRVFVSHDREKVRESKDPHFLRGRADLCLVRISAVIAYRQRSLFVLLLPGSVQRTHRPPGTLCATGTAGASNLTSGVTSSQFVRTVGPHADLRAMRTRQASGPCSR